jgi:C4-dicarboxylate-specific signal transduction histidine kinase
MHESDAPHLAHVDPPESPKALNETITSGQLTGSTGPDGGEVLVAVAADADMPKPALDIEPADVHAANAALERIIRRSSPVTEVLPRIRAFLTRRATHRLPLQLLDVIEDAVSNVQDVARAHQITLRVEPVVKLPPVIGERIQLQQLIVNLVMNGIEAMFDTPRNRRTLVIQARKHGTDAVLVRMRDSGKGLEPQERKRVFDPFYTTKPDGLGMGLAISRTIVEAHGGRLWASANDDCGETFQFTLPIAPGTERGAG